MEIQKQYKPTKKTMYFLCVIVLLAIVIPFFDFTFSSLTNFEELTKIDDVEFGYPLPFMIMQFAETDDTNPIKIWNFFIDLLLYSFIAYFLDVLMNLSWRTLKEKNKSFNEWTEKRSKRISEKKLLKKQTL